MPQRILLAILITFASLSLAGCELVVDIFQAGVWAGVILVIAVIALLIWGIAKLVKR